MIGIQETVERVMRRDGEKYQGRQYRYGSRVLIRKWPRATPEGTVIDCGYLDDSPVFDYVNQNGLVHWAYDSQLVEVLAY